MTGTVFQVSGSFVQVRHDVLLQACDIGLRNIAESADKRKREIDAENLLEKTRRANNRERTILRFMRMDRGTVGSSVRPFYTRSEAERMADDSENHGGAHRLSMDYHLGHLNKMEDHFRKLRSMSLLSSDVVNLVKDDISPLVEWIKDEDEAILLAMTLKMMPDEVDSTGS